MSKFLLSIFASIFIVSVSFAGKVAIINMQQVIKESKAGKEIQETLNKKVEELKKEIEKRQASGKNQENLQKYVFEKQQELNQLRQKMASKFMEMLRKAVSEFAKKYNYDLVLDQSPIIYGNKSLNKTEEFIKFFNTYYKKHKK